jgi:predicted acetyltransferase
MHLQKLSVHDGEAVYRMLQDIGTCENSFANPVRGMDCAGYKRWLLQQAEWSEGRNLPEGYVAQTVYWLVDGGIPVGIGKIRHALTAESRESGGNVGYAVASAFRGRGYGKALLGFLIEEAKKMELGEILLTIDKGNHASRKVVEANGGILVRENPGRWYFRVP